jgi:hypothetical protein
MQRLWLIVPATVLLAACGPGAATLTPAADSPSATPTAPTYAQVLNAIRAAHSVHETKHAGTLTIDTRADALGTVAGTFTVSGMGSLQFFASGSTFEAVADAQFVANCPCPHKPTPGVCQIFSPDTQVAVGLTSSDMALFTPAGMVQGFTTAVPTMTIDGRATVSGVATYVFKGSGRELYVPTNGSPLPIRVTRPGVYDTIVEWNTATPTKPASCP